MITRARAIEIAGQWHSVMTWSDQGVTLYALSSTGRVQSEDHRAKLLAYVKRLQENPEAGNSHSDLFRLHAYIAAAPIEPECVKFSSGNNDQPEPKGATP